jgi:nucleoside-diphosphate-sugar epimerase
MKKRLITGTKGFIGSALCAEAATHGFTVRVLLVLFVICQWVLKVLLLLILMPTSIGTMQIGAPGAIRTPDPLVRSQVLYPTELRALK